MPQTAAMPQTARRALERRCWLGKPWVEMDVLSPTPPHTLQEKQIFIPAQPVPRSARCGLEAVGALRPESVGCSLDPGGGDSGAGADQFCGRSMAAEMEAALRVEFDLRAVPDCVLTALDECEKGAMAIQPQVTREGSRFHTHGFFHTSG